MPASIISGGSSRSATPLLLDVIRIVFAFLLLCTAPWPASADDAKPLTTILLVARPQLRDLNFKDSVVLVMNNIASAPAGIILNRPTKIAVSKLFDDLERLSKLEDKLYFGGPVATGAVSFLFRADTPPERATRVIDGVYFSTSRDLLIELLARDKPMEQLKIFVGYSGWAPGQLEAEIERGDWSLAPADLDAIFGKKAEHPWPEQPAPDAAHRS